MRKVKLRNYWWTHPRPLSLLIVKSRSNSISWHFQTLHHVDWFPFEKSSGKDSCMTMILEGYAKEITWFTIQIQLESRKRCIGKEKVFMRFYRVVYLYLFLLLFPTILSQRQVNDRTKNFVLPALKMFYKLIGKLSTIIKDLSNIFIKSI